MHIFIFCFVFKNTNVSDKRKTLKELKINFMAAGTTTEITNNLVLCCLNDLFSSSFCTALIVWKYFFTYSAFCLENKLLFSSDDSKKKSQLFRFVIWSTGRALASHILDLEMGFWWNVSIRGQVISEAKKRLHHYRPWLISVLVKNTNICRNSLLSKNLLKLGQMNYRSGADSQI